MLLESLWTGIDQSLTKLGGDPSIFLKTLPDLFKVIVQDEGDKLLGLTESVLLDPDFRRDLSKGGINGLTINLCSLRRSANLRRVLEKYMILIDHKMTRYATYLSNCMETMTAHLTVKPPKCEAAISRNTSTPSITDSKCSTYL